MEFSQAAVGSAEDGCGIPDDMRCKRSDGKQWRCTAMCMPDKTVCEKHYIQAKKRAANSALRASMKKANRKSMGESEIYLESKAEGDEFDEPLINMTSGELPLPFSTKKFKDRVSKHQVPYSPETTPLRSSSMHNSMRLEENSEGDSPEFENSWRSHRTPTIATGDSSRSRSGRSVGTSGMMEYADGSSESSEEIGGQPCHQCQRRDKDGVTWCLKCERRGFCNRCISQWHSDIPLEDLQKVCPACRGTCNCKVCLRRDNFVKVRLREIPVLDKLQYLYSLLSSVLPVVRQIHNRQLSEVEVEKNLQGPELNLPRAKLSADEQMCCNICRIPIIDYHRHCANCMYDLCLHCCQDLREVSKDRVEEQASGNTNNKECTSDQSRRSLSKLNFSILFPDWKAGADGSIPCPPRKYGGCGYSSLSLSRIFKMNWVAKLVKNAEEMVAGCVVNNGTDQQNLEASGSNLCQCSYRADTDDNSLFFPTAEEIKIEGISKFRKHWSKGEPTLVKQVLNSSCTSRWDPVVIRSAIEDIADEKIKDETTRVKATDCLLWSEIDIKLDQFIEGYRKGGLRENGFPKLLRLKDWPSPNATEELLLYQGIDFISKLPLLEYIHSKWGLLNAAAKLPHYSLQNDVGPKIFISYGVKDELNQGNSVIKLHLKMRDMVYILAHTHNVYSHWDQVRKLDLVPSKWDTGGEYAAHMISNNDVRMQDRESRRLPLAPCTNVNRDFPDSNSEDKYEKTLPGVQWDVFRRQDVPKLIEFLQQHWKEFEKSGHSNDIWTNPLFDEGIYLNGQHKRKLKDEYGVEPWSFGQHLGQAVFIPAGCPFQLRNLQSTVQLGLDFLSPESVSEAARLAEEIRCLRNDHEAKVQILEVGKISLYAASSAIKEIQKLVLDKKYVAELGMGDPNLTASVSENLEKITKRKQIVCT